MKPMATNKFKSKDTSSAASESKQRHSAPKNHKFAPTEVSSSNKKIVKRSHSTILPSKKKSKNLFFVPLVSCHLVEQHSNLSAVEGKMDSIFLVHCQNVWRIRRPSRAVILGKNRVPPLGSRWQWLQFRSGYSSCCNS